MSVRRTRGASSKALLYLSNSVHSINLTHLVKEEKEVGFLLSRHCLQDPYNPPANVFPGFSVRIREVTMKILFSFFQLGGPHLLFWDLPETLEEVWPALQPALSVHWGGFHPGLETQNLS